MTVTVGQLNRWLDAPTDNSALEFEEARRDFARRRLFKCCVAIANEGGGSLVLGVTDNTPRQVVGSSVFPDLVDIEDEIHRNVNFKVGVSEVNHPDGRVVVFEIPSRPQGTAYAFEGKYLMCSGTYPTYMPYDKLRGIFTKDEPVFLEEPVKQGLAAQDIINLLDTHSYFGLRDQSYPSNREAVIEKFMSEHLIDQSEGLFSIRNIGALLFAKRLSDFDALYLKAPRVIVYNGPNKQSACNEWAVGIGYAAGFQELMHLVMTQVPQYERVKTAMREHLILVPQEAVKELVANALIHQDFTITGVDTKIEIYSNRVEISNPGKPVVEIDSFTNGARTRNERLADLMQRMNICRNTGSGIDRAKDAVERARLPALEFRVETNRTIAVIHGAKNFKMWA